MPANVVVPEVGESIVDARVAKWLKKEGDLVNVGDPLVELETDKIDLEVAAPQGGVLSRIAHGDGADVKVGEVLGIIDESASATDPASATAIPDTTADTRAGAPQTAKTESAPSRPAAAGSQPRDLHADL